MAVVNPLRSVGPAGRPDFERGRVVASFTMLACGAVSVLDASGVTGKIVVGVLMACAWAGLVLSRRARPSLLGGLGVVAGIGAGLAVIVLAPSGLGEVPVLVGAANVPYYAPEGPQRTAAVMAVSAAFGVSIMVISGSPIGLLAGVGAWLIAGTSVQRESLRVERDRAVALLAEVEASRQAQAEAVAAEERNRIATEMHDVLAHSLAGLSIRLQAIRAIAGREGVSAAVTDQLDSAAALARDGLHEAREAVGALRGPQRRGVADLKDLIAAFPGDADLEVRGPAGFVDADAAHAVYRAVQEAVTNAARYASGSHIGVEVAWSPAELRVSVTDNGVPVGHQASGVRGSATGLAAMAKRVEAVGGTLTAGPVVGAGSGWCVEVRVPATASRPASPAAAATVSGRANTGSRANGNGQVNR